MLADVEGRDADVRGRQRRRHVPVRDTAGKPDASRAARGLLGRGTFGSLADQDRLVLRVALRVKALDGLDELNGAMPRAEGAREHGHDGGRITGPGHGAGRAGMEPLRVRAPFDLQHAIGRHAVGQNLRAWRDDQIRLAHLPVAPAPHRLRDERAIERGLRRAGVVDDGRVDLERESRAGGFRRQSAFTAEVVVPLDDHVRPDRSGKPPYRTRTQQAKLRSAGRWAHRVPVHRTLRPRAVAAPGDGVHLVAQRCEAFGHRLHVHRSAERPRHALVERAVENPHVSVSPSRARAGRRTVLSGRARRSRHPASSGP